MTNEEAQGMYNAGVAAAVEDRFATLRGTVEPEETGIDADTRPAQGVVAAAAQTAASLNSDERYALVCYVRCDYDAAKAMVETLEERLQPLRAKRDRLAQQLDGLLRRKAGA
jgi:hypothetical protein